MHFVKKLMKLRVGRHLLLGLCTDETTPLVESVAAFGLVRGLCTDLSVSEPVTPGFARIPLG